MSNQVDGTCTRSAVSRSTREFILISDENVDLEAQRSLLPDEVRKTATRDAGGVCPCQAAGSRAAEQSKRFSPSGS